MVTLAAALAIDMVTVQVTVTVATIKKVIARASTATSLAIARVVGTVTLPGASTEQQTDDEINRDSIAVCAIAGC